MYLPVMNSGYGPSLYLTRGASETLIHPFKAWLAVVVGFIMAAHMSGEHVTVMTIIWLALSAGLAIMCIVVVERLWQVHQVGRALKGHYQIPFFSHCSMLEIVEHWQTVKFVYGLDDDLSENSQEVFGEYHVSRRNGDRKAFAYPIEVGRPFTTRCGIRLRITAIPPKEGVQRQIGEGALQVEVLGVSYWRMLLHM